MNIEKMRIDFNKFTQNKKVKISLPSSLHFTLSNPQDNGPIQNSSIGFNNFTLCQGINIQKGAKRRMPKIYYVVLSYVNVMDVDLTNDQEKNERD